MWFRALPAEALRIREWKRGYKKSKQMRCSLNLAVASLHKIFYTPGNYHFIQFFTGSNCLLLLISMLVNLRKIYDNGTEPYQVQNNIHRPKKRKEGGLTDPAFRPGSKGFTPESHPPSGKSMY
jgi:hypothetical protein